MKSKPFHRSNITLLATTACAMLSLPLTAGEKVKKSKEIIVPAEESHVHFLFDVTFASAYNTPRGMMVRANGLTVQPLFLMFIDLYKGDGFINSVKAVGGCWNDLGTVGVSKQGPYGSDPKTNWTEIDPIGGLSIGFGKYFTLDATYIGFAEQILNIGMVHSIETKISYNDSELLGAFALHPYFLYWQELENKTTNGGLPGAILPPSPLSGAHPAPGSSHYFEVGITPSYTFKEVGDLKVEAPFRVLFPDSRFYGEYYGSSSVVGLVEAGLKASAPLKFMPKGYGSWTGYAGFKYQYYVDKNLYNLQAFNAPGQATRDSWTFYTGFSVFF